MRNMAAASFYLVLLVFVFATGRQSVHGWIHHPHHPRPGHARQPHGDHANFFKYHKKIFVFGDSYADTGNSKKTEESWKVPYGMSIPGFPTGRYSDGIVLTDFFAKHFGVVGLGRPMPYQQWKKARSPILHFGSLLFGMNFAHGGTGVFDTAVNAPNMTAQIDLFEQVVDRHYRSFGMENSIALVTLAGNDYTTYLAEHNGTINTTDVMHFIDKVTQQLSVNLKRIQALGVKKIAVANLQELDCTPRVTASNNFSQCNGDIGLLVNYHNIDVEYQVGLLNQATKNNTFVILDLAQAFSDVLLGKDYTSRFPKPLEACCLGTTADGYCAVVDDDQKPLYTVCKEPWKSFFWDMVHPTEAGWEAVFERLQPTFKLLEEDQNS